MINQILRISDKDVREAEWEKYRKHFMMLPESLRPQVFCEICRKEPTYGTSGFHGFSASEYDPISFCGWADYGDREFDQGVEVKTDGVRETTVPAHSLRSIPSDHGKRTV